MLLLLEKKRLLQARRFLEHFTVFTKPDYEANWHHQVMFRALDGFADGRIKRLMLFAPPRHGKSEIASRRLPAYLLGRNPNTSIISASYSADLASRMNRDVQRIIDEPAYQRLFPNTKLWGKNIRTVAQSYLRNSDIFEVVGNRGVYRSSGVGGGITGMGGNYLLIDDPLKNEEEASSETIRESIWEWYTTTLYTRQAKDAGILLIMTRWNEDDLAGRLLALADKDPAADKWTIISLPAVAEEDEEHRRKGQPLWPSRFNEAALAAIRASLGSYHWSALYQQRPTPMGGARFRSSWWRRYRRDNETFVLDDGTFVVLNQLRIVITLDPAGRKTKKSKYTAILVCADIGQDRLLVLEVVRQQLALEEIVPALHRLCQKWRPDWVGIEANGFQMMLVQQARNHLLYPGIPTVMELQPEGKSKLVRATPAILRAEQGKIYLPDAAEWLYEFENELQHFTGNEKADAYSDQTDTLAYGVLGLDRFGSGNDAVPLVLGR